MNKIQKLESIRGFIALFVVLCHVFEGLGSTFFVWHLGPLGVMVFFVLSGFVINLSYQQSRDKSFKYYLSKRFLRIYIPLIILLIFSYFYLGFQKDSPNDLRLVNVLANIFMLQGIFAQPIFGNGPLWSLSYEWWYYMLFIPLLRLPQKAASITIYSTGMLISVASFFINLPQFSYFFILLMVWWFGVDVSNAYLRNRGRIYFKDIQWSILPLFIGGLILSFTVGNQLALQIAVLILLGFTWYKSGWILFDKTIGLFHSMGAISYVVYISHWPLVCQASYLDQIVDFVPLRYTLYILVCLLFSYVVECKIYPALRNIEMRNLFPSKGVSVAN